MDVWSCTHGGNENKFFLGVKVLAQSICLDFLENRRDNGFCPNLFPSTTDKQGQAERLPEAFTSRGVEHYFTLCIDVILKLPSFSRLLSVCFGQ